MSNRNTALNVLSAAATILTAFSLAFFLWQSGRIAVNQKRWKNESTELERMIQAVDSRIEQRLNRPSPAGTIKTTAQLYAFLTQTAAACRLQIAQLNLKPAQGEDGTANPQLSISLIGNYGQAMNFLAAVRQLPGFRILKLDLSAHNGGPNQTLKLSLSFYLPVTNEVQP